jgi:hypothetical protein
MTVRRDGLRSFLLHMVIKKVAKALLDYDCEDTVVDDVSKVECE